MYTTNLSDENINYTIATIMHNPKCSAPAMLFTWLVEH